MRMLHGVLYLAVNNGCNEHRFLAFAVVELLPFRYQNAGKNHDIKIANRCFENMAQFKYLETTVTNQILIQEKIKRRFNSVNACYHSVQNHLSFRLLSENIKIRIYKTKILPLLCMGVKLGL
jgi:hypothetical protein